MSFIEIGPHQVLEQARTTWYWLSWGLRKYNPHADGLNALRTKAKIFLNGTEEFSSIRRLSASSVSSTLSSSDDMLSESNVTDQQPARKIWDEYQQHPYRLRILFPIDPVEGLADTDSKDSKEKQLTRDRAMILAQVDLKKTEERRRLWQHLLADGGAFLRKFIEEFGINQPEWGGASILSDSKDALNSNSTRHPAARPLSPSHPTRSPFSAVLFEILMMPAWRSEFHHQCSSLLPIIRTTFIEPKSIPYRWFAFFRSGRDKFLNSVQWEAYQVSIDQQLQQHPYLAGQYWLAYRDDSNRFTELFTPEQKACLLAEVDLNDPKDRTRFYVYLNAQDKKEGKSLLQQLRVQNELRDHSRSPDSGWSRLTAILHQLAGSSGYNKELLEQGISVSQLATQQMAQTLPLQPAVVEIVEVKSHALSSQLETERNEDVSFSAVDSSVSQKKEVKQEPQTQTLPTKKDEDEAKSHALLPQSQTDKQQEMSSSVVTPALSQQAETVQAPPAQIVKPKIDVDRVISQALTLAPPSRIERKQEKSHNESVNDLIRLIKMKPAQTREEKESLIVKLFSKPAFRLAFYKHDDAVDFFAAFVSAVVNFEAIQQTIKDRKPAVNETLEFKKWEDDSHEIARQVQASQENFAEFQQQLARDLPAQDEEAGEALRATLIKLITAQPEKANRLLDNNIFSPKILMSILGLYGDFEQRRQLLTMPAVKSALLKATAEDWTLSENYHSLYVLILLNEDLASRFCGIYSQSEIHDLYQTADFELKAVMLMSHSLSALLSSFVSPEEILLDAPRIIEQMKNLKSLISLSEPTSLLLKTIQLASLVGQQVQGESTKEALFIDFSPVYSKVSVVSSEFDHKKVDSKQQSEKEFLPQFKRIIEDDKNEGNKEILAAFKKQCIKLGKTDEVRLLLQKAEEQRSQIKIKLETPILVDMILTYQAAFAYHRILKVIAAKSTEISFSTLPRFKAELDAPRGLFAQLRLLELYLMLQIRGRIGFQEEEGDSMILAVWNNALSWIKKYPQAAQPLMSKKEISRSLSLPLEGMVEIINGQKKPLHSKLALELLRSPELCCYLPEDAITKLALLSTAHARAVLLYAHLHSQELSNIDHKEKQGPKRIRSLSVEQLNRILKLAFPTMLPEQALNSLADQAFLHAFLTSNVRYATHVFKVNSRKDKLLQPFGIESKIELTSTATHSDLVSSDVRSAPQEILSTQSMPAN